MKCFAILLALLIGINAQKPNWEPTYLGQTHVKHAAFLSIYQSEDTSLEYEDQFTMYVSTFDPALIGVYDEVWYMRSLGRYLDDVDNWKRDYITELDKSALWPNNMDYVPSGASAGSNEGIIQTSGFLVVGKADGQLQYYDTTVEPPAGPVNIASSDTNEWSYHRVIWKDMDLDGDLDAVTCRFHQPLVGFTKHEFMWFENAGIGFVEGWTEHVISDQGPDVHFDNIVLSVDGLDYDTFVFGEFFKERVSIYWTDSVDFDWSDTSLVDHRIISETGQVFDVLVDDFNKDGAEEFVATEYFADENNGLLRVYFPPADFRVDTFDSTILADGFQAPPSGAFAEYMTPGTPKTFYPTTAYANEVAEDGLSHKPMILLSGDDDGCFYVLDPQTEDRNDWSYDKNLLLNTTETTVGKMAHADLDGDGYEEIVLAGYSAGQLYVYSYAP